MKESRGRYAEALGVDRLRPNVPLAPFTTSRSVARRNG